MAAKTWSEKLGFSAGSVKNRLKRAQQKGIKAVLKQGNVVRFFTEKEVRQACADLLKALPRAGKDNFFEWEGGKYGTYNAWSKLLGFNGGTIKRRLNKQGKGEIKGRDVGNRISRFVSEKDVREVCSDLFMTIEEVRVQVKAVLAHHDIDNRQTLIQFGSDKFTKISFPPFGKGITVASAVLEEPVGNLTHAELHRIADVLFDKERSNSKRS